MKQAIQAGDVIREAWPTEMAQHVNLYLGSGRFGSCFDAWGLMNNGAPSSSDMTDSGCEHSMSRRRMPPNGQRSLQLVFPSRSRRTAWR